MPSWAQDLGVPYELGSCSRVVYQDCEGDECTETVEPLRGGFTLSPGPGEPDGDGVKTFVLDRLRLRGEGTEGIGVKGHGVLVVTDTVVSLLGTLDVGDGEELMVGGSGSASGTFPGALHLLHLVVGDVRFEVYAAPASWGDDDCDGVADGDDLCPASACAVPVDGGGCAISQLCPCASQPNGRAWRSHRQYVRCVIGASRELLALGKLDTTSRGGLVREAARSSCGSSAIAALFEGAIALR